MKTLLIDIETYSDENLTDSGVYRYVESDAFRVLLFAYSVDYSPARIVSLAEGEEIPLEIRDAVFDPTVVKLAHNMVFELTCLSKFFGRELSVEQWQDTMIEAARLGFPMSLATLGSVLGLEKQKMTEGRALIRWFSCPDKNGNQRAPLAYPEKWDTYKAYCLRDVDTEVEVAKKVMGKTVVPAWERELQLADYRINKRGVRIDLDFVRKAIEFTELNKQQLLEEAKKLTKMENPNSVSQLKEWIHRTTGYKMESLNKKAIEDLPLQYLGPDVRRMVEIRKELGKTSLAKYPAMVDFVCRDNRARGILQYYGATQSGRWAGRNIQLQNLPQNHLKDLDEARSLVKNGNYEEFEMAYTSVPFTLSELIRTAFIPSEGNTFYICDFSAIECRVIAWLAGEKWVLDTFRQGGDIYCATASKMFGVPVEKHGQNAELRQKGKIATLALGYQGGVGALKAMGGERMGLREDEMNGIVKLWRKSNPNIVALWGQTEKAAKSCLSIGKAVGLRWGICYSKRNGILFAKLPSGREIAYPRAGLIEDEEGIRITYERMNQMTKKWETAETYGGKLVENLVQSIARDILAQVILRCEKQDLPIVFHVHDEVIVDAPPSRTLAEVEEIFSQPIEWCPGLPLKGAGYTGKYYYKD